MMVHEDGTSKSSGYVEIPIQVLYKTEYIDSVVQQRKKTKSLTNIMKKAKLRITNTLGKLRDRISSALRGYYQEIVINNVDGKTRQNMMGYIKSMNLETKEFVDGDGTRVIIVDIAPIKKKPEMNDLLVYIENEKLKIARRTEAKAKGPDNKDQDLSSNKWSVQNHGETSVCDTTTHSEKMLQVHPRGGGDGIIRSSRAIGWERDKTKNKYKSKKGTTENNNSIKNGVSEIRPDSKKDYVIYSRMLDSKELCLEDPLTKAEKRVKLRMRSKSKATVRTDSTWGDRDKSCSRTIYTCQSSSTEEIGKNEMSRFNSSTVESSSDRMGWSINSFINPQMNGIGVFWNAQSVMYNDTKINLIERSNAIKDKEMSVNVIAKYYNKEEQTKPVQLTPDIIRTPHYKEKGTEIDNSICMTEMKATKETQILADTVEEKASTTKSKVNKRYFMDIQKQPVVEMEDVELHVSNGLTSQPSFQFETVMTKIGPSIHDEMKINKSLEKGKIQTAEKTKNNKKKKIKFTKFCKKLFTNKNQTKEPENIKLRNEIDDSKEVPVEVFVKYTPTNHHGKFKDGGKRPIDFSTNEKKLDSTFTNKYYKKKNKIKDDGIASKTETCSGCPTDNRSKRLTNVYYATENRQHWYNDRGDNIKTLPTSDIDISKIEVPQSSTNMPFNWDTQVERMKEKRNKRRNVVNKLYNKLRSFRNHKEMSGSEITSSTYTLEDMKKGKENENYCYDDFTLSSLDSVRVSVDTVQSVTQTVIKRLAKSYPKEKRT